jgi:hypothetical protein
MMRLMCCGDEHTLGLCWLGLNLVAYKRVTQLQWFGLYCKVSQGYAYVLKSLEKVSIFNWAYYCPDKIRIMLLQKERERKRMDSGLRVYMFCHTTGVYIYGHSLILGWITS